VLYALLITCIHTETFDQPHHPSKSIKISKNHNPLACPQCAWIFPRQLCTCAHLFFVQLCTNAQLSEKQPCMSAQLSVRQAHISCAPVCPTLTPTCTVVSSTTTHYVQEMGLYPHTYAWVFPLFPCTCGPLPLKPPVRPSVQPLPTNYEIHKVQDDRTTNLSLATPRSVASRSRNLEISSQLSRQLNNSDRYK
jgi:hypothetical protein